MWRDGRGQTMPVRQIGNTVYWSLDARPRVVNQFVGTLSGSTGGDAFVSNTIVGGSYVLRDCIVNFHTGLADVEALPEIVARIGQAVDAALRPALG